MGKSRLVVLLLVFGFVGTSYSALADDDKEGNYLYRVSQVRATPGKLNDLIAFYKSSKQKTPDHAPFIMRHSQGDQWDLMLLYPMGSFEDYYSTEKVTKRHRVRKLASKRAEKATHLVAYQGDLFARGSHVDILSKAFEGNDFYHVEMFHALPGKHQELLQQRRMENAYLAETGQTDNFIFRSELGLDVDVFTIGFYPSIMEFAASSPVSEQEAEDIAKKVGFENRSSIGTYLRSLISRHHDTLAIAVE